MEKFERTEYLQGTTECCTVRTTHLTIGIKSFMVLQTPAESTDFDGKASCIAFVCMICINDDCEVSVFMHWHKLLFFFIIKAHFGT